MHYGKMLLLFLASAQMASAAPTNHAAAPAKPGASESVSDKAKPDKGNGQLPKPPAPPTQPTQPPTENQYSGVGKVDSVTRQSGGEVYRLELVKAIPLVRIELKSKLGRSKIYSASLVTDKNDRVPLRLLTGINIDDGSAAVSSEILNVQTNIVAVEILAEAMGGESSVDIIAYSTKEAPRLALANRVPEFSCKRSLDSLLKDKLDPVQLWVGRAEGAAPGSVQEKFAGNQLKEQVRDFVSTIKSGGSYTTLNYLITLINFFADQYNNVRVGGVSEPAYRDLLQAGNDVMMIAIQNELPCRKFPSDTLIKISTDFAKKLQSMPADARARGLYEKLTTRVRDYAPDQYRKEIGAANLSFRDADNEGIKHYKNYISAKDGEFLKETSKSMSAYAFMVAENALKVEVKMMDVEQRYQLIVEFQGKYNSNGEYPQAVAARYLNILAEQTFGYRLFR
ncbi:beta-sandwich domain-containing protein [Bdellovibrio sp. KM01]|uniref:beta-sandwich domain-containing protein n=1 Tax=Bdellovibrio sp. KM01 TaxID=2748865 RepID=UPI002105C0CC|nr:beta-sandwich domain-containing protein [Bdellovibrio sp. KM01]